MKCRSLGQICASGRTVTIEGSNTVCEAARLLTENRIGAVLVTHGRCLDGILSERDVVNRVVAVGLDPKSTMIADVMTRDMITVAPETDAVEALHIMQENGFRHLPVVGPEGVVGMVSLRDFLGREMAEVQEEISFEGAVAEELW